METQTRQWALSKSDSWIVAACLAAAACSSLALALPADSTVLALVAGAGFFLVMVWDIRLLVPVIAITLPFGPRFTMPFGSLYLTTAVLLVAYAAALVRAPMSRRPFALSGDGVSRSLMVFMAVFLVSALQNYAFLFSNQASLLRFVQFYVYLGIFLLVMRMDLSRARIKALLALILAVGVAEAIYGIAQSVRNPGFYITGTHDFVHNHFSAHMMLVWLMFVGVLLEARGAPQRAAAIAGLVITGYANVFAFSRTGYVAMVTGPLVFLALPIGRLKKVLLAVLTAVCGVTAWLVIPFDVLYRAADIYSTVAGRAPVSFKYRLTMWREAWADFLESPILGKGAWAYSLRDNFFVRVTAESGILGLAAFLVVVYLILRRGKGLASRRTQDDFMRGLTVALVPVACAVLIVFNLAGDFFQVHRIIGTFWLVLALVLKYHSSDDTSIDPDRLAAHPRAVH